MKLRRKSKYLAPELPDGLFMLVDDNGDDKGPLYRSDFGVNEDGTWVASGEVGSPLFLRVIRQEGDFIWHVDQDGKGETWRYRIVPIVPVTRDF